MTDNSVRTAALTSKAWPYEEARKLLKRWPDGKPGGQPMVFETGYGPSGLPHIGTFNEVARTTFVRQAYEELTGAPTRLIAFSDDMDGLRKVPDNIPNAQMLADNLGMPLTKIPDPFGTHDSFAHHNNAMLRSFLDRFGFDYDFVSATDCYRSRRVRRHHPQGAARVGLDHGRDAADARRGPPQDLFAGASGLADHRPSAAGPGRGDRRRGRPDRASTTRTAAASRNRRSAASPSCSGRSTGRRAGSRSGSTTRCRARI